MPVPGINDPAPYYAQDPAPSLAWEMTVCQCLATLESPYQAALRRPGRYGALVAQFLGDRAGLGGAEAVVEIGGGCGTLMAALLDAVPLRAVTMVDVSPVFLEEQRRALAGRVGVRFVRADAMDFLRSIDGPLDVVVSNENIGDLPTYTAVPRDQVLSRLETGVFREGPPPGDIVGHVAEKAARYGLDLSCAPETFAFNIGAIEYLEALAPRARAVWIAEHSCDAVVPAPYDDFVSLPPSDGCPRRVPLRGHDEYTIKFEHLETVAGRLGYRAKRFHLMEFLDLRHDDAVRFMVRSANHLSELAEVIHEFYHHVAEYEAMLLTRV